MLQAVNTKVKRKNAATQTKDTDNMLEIARLQEQVKLLQIEVDHLRKYNNENTLGALRSITPTTSPINANETPKDTEAKSKALQNQSLQMKNSRVATRGCNCKGKCSSKVCGCVKKDTRCGEWCRCNNGICKNQEDGDIDYDKENLEHNELRRKPLKNQEIVNKQLADVKTHRGLFSPDVAIPASTVNVEQFDIAPLSFGSPKKLTFGSDEEGDREYESKNVTKRSKKLEENGKKITKQKRGRGKKTNIEANDSEHVGKDGFTSDEGKQTVRRRNPAEISTSDMDLNEIEKQTNNYTQNIKKGMVSLRRGQKGFKQNKIRETRITNDIDSNEGTSSVSMNDTAKTTQNNKINVTPHVSEPQEIDSHKIQTSRRNESFDTNKGSDNEFDPMKPKHELPRTPVRGGNNETMSSNNSATSLSTPSISTNEEEPDIPAELSQPQVNWEEYQSQLVACDKCKRKFHPLRIKKHASCCKKI